MCDYVFHFLVCICATEIIFVSISYLMSLISVERVFKFVGSVPQGDDVKRKDLLVCFPRSTVDPPT